MIDNILDNNNYTNKDFQSVYEELVNTIGKLNNKWLIDGEGNESDPGVVLVKSIAAAVDKLSYIMDKHSLENYPDTVATEKDARLIFSPVYNMKWYRSASGSISITNIGDTDITIPAMLMLCSEDKSAIYTINSSENVTIQPKTSHQFDVLEGRIKTLAINGSDCITINNFVDNVIYLDDYNVAQNGIWVEDYQTDNSVGKSTTWMQSDNLYLEDWSTNVSETNINQGKYYEFKIDPITNKPCLHFVDDLVDKIGDGLKIRYLISQGKLGNISAGKITEVYASDSELTIDSDNLRIINSLPILNGKNPETLEEGRRNYFKDIDICNTLVTLRDYANAIYLGEDLVSNCFVCDRNNDVQYSYKIKSSDGQMIDKVEQISDGDVTEDALQVYQLKFYGIGENNPQITAGVENGYSQEVKNVLYKLNYDSTFEIINPTQYGDPTNITLAIERYIKNIKSISHEFSSIRNQNKPCLFINLYSLNISLLYKQKLSNEQQVDIQNKIYLALLENLNARMINFGERITYETVQDIIYSTDPRILGASISGLDDVDFTTYAIYWTPFFAVPYYSDGQNPTNGNIKVGDYAVIRSGADTYTLSQFSPENQWESVGLPIDGASISHQLPTDTAIKFTGIKSRTNTWNYDYRSLVGFSGSKYISISQPTKPIEGTDEVVNIKIPNRITSTTGIETGFYPSTPRQYTYMANHSYVDADGVSKTGSGFFFQSGGVNYFAEINKYSNGSAIIWKYGEAITFYYNNAGENDIPVGSFLAEQISSKIIEDGFDSDCELGESTLRGQIQADVYAKSVLAGNTSLYDTNSSYQPKISDTNVQANFNINYLEPKFELQLTSEYQLRENEYIQILNPEYSTVATYQFYVYMGYYNTNTDVEVLTIGENNNYQLKDSEYVIFYYRNSDEVNYSYSVYGGGYVLSPSKTIVLYNFSNNFQSVFINPSASGLYNVNGVATNYVQSQIMSHVNSAYSNGRLTALKSTDSCEVKVINNGKLNADNGYKYKFTTNHFDVSQNEYSITFDANYYYVIEETESFWVYDKNDNLIIILGAGCVLKCADVPKIYSDGETLQSLSSGIEIQYTQCEITQLSPNTFIRPIFSGSAEYQSNTSVTSADQGYSDAGANEKILIRASNICPEFDSNNQCKANLVVSDNPFGSGYDYHDELNAYIESVANIRTFIDSTSVTFVIKFINQSINSSNQIVQDSVVYFTATYDITSQTELTLTGNFQVYNSLPEIQYLDSENTTYTSVNKSIVSDFEQLIRSALLIDVASNKTQKIGVCYKDANNLSKQSVYGYQNIVDSTPAVQITYLNNIPDENVNEIMNMSVSSDVYIIGGKQQLSTPIQIYATADHANIGDIDDDGYEIDYIDSQIVIKPNEQAQLDLPDVVFGDGYIIFMTISQLDPEGTSTISITDDLGEIQTTLYNEEIYDLTIAQGNSIIVKTTNTSQLNIYFDSTIQNNLIISVNKNIIPYAIKPELYDSDGDIMNNILSRMAELDVDQEYFIEAGQTYPIVNPISAASFFDAKHIYNKFTIGKINAINWRT